MKQSSEQLVPEEYGAIGQIISTEEAKNRQASQEPRQAYHNKIPDASEASKRRKQAGGQRAKSVMVNQLSAAGRRGITLLGEANSQVTQLVAAVGQQHRQVNNAAIEEQNVDPERFTYELPFLNKYVGYRS